MAFWVTVMLFAVSKGLYFWVVVHMMKIHLGRNTKDIKRFICRNTFWVHGMFAAVL